MTTEGGLASSATRRVAGDEGWDDAVLIWNGTVTVVPELRQDVPAKQGLRRRG